MARGVLSWEWEHAIILTVQNWDYPASDQGYLEGDGVDQVVVTSMRQVLEAAVLACVVTLPAYGGEVLQVVYPPPNHQTTADRIFLIGTAPPDGEVTVNGERVGDRSPTGNFAPSLPLQLGDNTFTLRYRDQTVTRQVKRLSTQVLPPTTATFAENSLTPKVDIARQVNEPICFEVIAPPNSTVSVQLANQIIPMLPQVQAVDLPPNSAALTQTNQPEQAGATGLYQGCSAFAVPGNLGQPLFQLTLNGQTHSQLGPGSVTILSPAAIEGVDVTSLQGVARTGPSTNYSRLTPLPKGTRARINGTEGEWLRLDYGGWIKQAETRPLPTTVVPHAIIRSFRSRQVPGWTEVVLPLTSPVPVSVKQGDRTFTLTLYNATAQTDTAFLDDDPVIDRLDWQQVAPGQIEYQLNLKPKQQWGYKLRYEGTSLVLSLRHPPNIRGGDLSGVKILLDPGHGSKNDLGAVGPTGVPEKDVTIVVSQLLQAELTQRGATVVMTREGDDDLYPQDRVDVINETEPAIALSIHYNALPDNGDAINTAGIGTFWYHAQSHSLAVFLENYLVTQLNRPSYGIFWNNLALTRPTVAPSVLLELGFMINPTEFEWVMDPNAQQQLATTLANGITQWLSETTQAAHVVPD